MKRYTLKTAETVDVHEMGMKTEIRRTHAIVPDDFGELVLYADVLPVIQALEDRIPEIRIERLEKALGLVSQGRCPECGQKTAGWKCPSGSFAPEMVATLREGGIDIGTGHKVTCSRRNQS